MFMICLQSIVFICSFTEICNKYIYLIILFCKRSIKKFINKIFISELLNMLIYPFVNCLLYAAYIIKQHNKRRKSKKSCNYDNT